MITVRINGDQREFEATNVPESWIAQQIVARKRDGQAVCVRVTVRDDPISPDVSSGPVPIVGQQSREPQRSLKASCRRLEQARSGRRRR